MLTFRGVPGILLVVSFSLAIHSQAQPYSDQPRPDFWVTDGPVRAMAATNDTLYIGGDFSYIGPITGYGVPVDRVTAVAADDYPRVNGLVSAVAADGAGGWFIGGDFTQVGALPREGLAHIRADGTVDSDWMATITGGVGDILVGEGIVYVAGPFTTVSGTGRNHLAALDATTGNVLDWDPKPDGEVTGLALLDGTIYFGGEFTQVGGTDRPAIAAVDAVTGELSSWPNLPELALPPYGFRAINAREGRVFVSAMFPGNFEIARDFVAMDPVTGEVLWSHLHNLTGTAPNGWLADIIAVEVGRLWVAPRGKAVISVDPATGEEIWLRGFVGWISDIVAVDDSVYVGGRPRWFGALSDKTQTERPQLARFDAATGDLLDWSPLANGTVRAMAAAGDTIYVGGYFQSLGGEPRSNLAAIDTRTGRAIHWNAAVVSGNSSSARDGINALAVQDDRLWFGGAFTSVGGMARMNLAAVDRHSGDVLDLATQVNGPVNTLALTVESLFAGGVFSQVAGVDRSNIAAVDPASGQLLDWRADTDGEVLKLSVTGDHLLVGGAFNSLGGEVRSNLGAVDRATGVPAAWDPSPDNRVTGLAVSYSTVYFAGRFENVGAIARAGLAASDLSTGDLLAWVPTTSTTTNTDDFTFSTPLLINGNQILFGGRGDHLMAPVDLVALHDFDSVSGLEAGWQPQVFGAVYSLLSHNEQIFVGGHVRTGDIGRFLLAFAPPGYSRLETVRRIDGEWRLRLRGGEGTVYEIDKGTLNDDWTVVDEVTIKDGAATIQFPTSHDEEAFYRARLKE